MAVKSKRDLPFKICPVCGRPFSWRRKWKACWDDVRYCSERCRRNRKSAPEDRTAGDRAAAEPAEP